MREICAVLRSGDAKGAAPAQAPIGAVYIYMDDNKVEGHVDKRTRMPTGD